MRDRRRSRWICLLFSGTRRWWYRWRSRAICRSLSCHHRRLFRKHVFEHIEESREIGALELAVSVFRSNMVVPLSSGDVADLPLCLPIGNIRMIYTSIYADMLSRSDDHILCGRDKHYRSIVREAVLYPYRYWVSVGRASESHRHSATKDEE